MTQGAIWVVLSRAGSGDARAGGSSGCARAAVFRHLGRARRRPVVAVVAGLVAGGVLLLAGCGSSPPDPQPTLAGVTATPTPTPTPTPSVEPVTAPTRPAEMDNPDDTGAIAAAAYFMQLNSYAYRSGDLSEWLAASGDTCDFCTNTTARVQEAYALGHRVEGQTITVDKPRVLAFDDDLALYSVELHYELAAGVEVDGVGTPVRELPAGEGYIVLDLVPSYRGWVLVGGDAQDGPAL